MKAGAVVLLGMVLAMGFFGAVPVWGHSDAAMRGQLLAGNFLPVRGWRDGVVDVHSGIEVVFNAFDVERHHGPNVGFRNFAEGECIPRRTRDHPLGRPEVRLAGCKLEAGTIDSNGSYWRTLSFDRMVNVRPSLPLGGISWGTSLPKLNPDTEYIFVVGEYLSRVRAAAVELRNSGTTRTGTIARAQNHRDREKRGRKPRSSR